jgi:hypothetical protein
MTRDRELAPGHRSDATSARPARRANNPVLALQRAAGNQAVSQWVARQPVKGVATTPTVQIGKLKIDVDGGNTGEWAASKKGEAPDKLVVTSHKGKHSAQLEKLFKAKTKIDKLTLTVPPANKSEKLGVGSVVIEIGGGRITEYSVDGDTESWTVARFATVNKTTTTHTIGQ